MEDILYVKVEQNMVVQKKTLTYEDIATLYCQNQNIVKKLNKEIFYTLDPKQQKTMFTIEKVYQGIHKVYPGLRIENVGERDFIVDLEVPDGKEKSRTMQYIKTAVVCLVSFFGAAFTIMTFNEDVSVSKVFDHVYEFVMGVKKSGGSALEVSYAIGLPLGILVFYNHINRRKIKHDPTPIQVEMCTYEEQVNKAMIKLASREGKSIDAN